MRRLLLACLAIALGVGGCAASGSGSDVLNVLITRLEARGTSAVLEYTIEGDAESVTVSIDWGDGSEPVTVAGSGAAAASHQYSPDIDAVVVTVVATHDDGRVGQAGQALAFGASTASASPTASPSGTASPSPSPSPTPTSSPTPTPTPTTRPTPTPTPTLAPEALEQIHDLELQTADVVDELISPTGADGTAAPAGGELRLVAETFGLDGPISVQSRVQWLIPEEEWRKLGAEPRLSVIMDYGYTVVLDTGPNRGRSAEFEFNIVGSNDAQPLLGQGAGALVTIDEGDHVDTGYADRTGFGTPLAPNASGPIRITLIATCIVTPGETIFQVGESSICRAELHPTIRVRLTRTQGL